MNAVLALHSPRYAELARKTLFQNRVEYCKTHGYLPIFREVADPANDQERHQVLGFGRLHEVLRAFSDNHAIEWIWVADIDGMVTNMKKALPIAEAGTHDLLITADCHGINAGSILIKNSRSAKDYLRFILDHKNQWEHEQRAFQRTYEYSTHTVGIAQQRVMNSYDYRLYAEALKRTSEYPALGYEHLVVDGQWQPGDFFIHWPGLSLEQRLQQQKIFEQEVGR
jgi:hypothetical protein